MSSGGTCFPGLVPAFGHVMLSLLAMCSSACISVSGDALVYREPSHLARRILISRVAIVPNRMPINVKNAGYWRRYNWSKIRELFEKKNIAVVDYESSVQLFEESGLPIEDRKASRDKYAELAKKLNVDAVVIPCYGTMFSVDGILIRKHEYGSFMTLKIYIT